MTGRFLLLGGFSDQGFGGQEQTGDGRTVLKGGASDLGGIDDPGREHIAPFAGLGVKAEFGIVALLDLADDDGSIYSGVFRDIAGRLLDGSFDDVGTVYLVSR